MRRILFTVFVIICIPFKLLLLLPYKLLAFFFDAAERFKQHNDRKKQWMRDLEADKKLRQNRYK